MKIKKRHVLLASLVFALSAAVYLNWQLSDSKGLSVADTAKELGAASYVNSSITTTDESSVNADVKNESGLSKEQLEYFATSRTERQKAQDEVIQLARQILELSDSSDEAKEEAAEQLSHIEEIILGQNRIETTLKAKGFSDCICCLSETSCTVIIPANEMVDNSLLIIKDCVDETADLPFENISIVEV
ncbi:MAG: SpoIIIAH-like family protein [Ruminococcus sp.]|nr:SpoIIIAH-like family protein [Ruminococcus sp.]